MGKATRRSSEVPSDQIAFGTYSRRRCCVVMAADSRSTLPKAGTGTMLEHRGALYVLTCAHVVDDFENYGVGWISFFAPPLQVDRRSCSVVHRDARLDIAVLAVGRAAAAKVRNR